ncbi:helix-turn-helix domain-containing protein [Mucilaginibacter pedocola]|uniref:AraC family transcriptional regulator n=1 Tax=Mucilaginibacter pedocola TaxID=1792845 RepID=A0A1S9PM53_9SPHI|nr:AraC family transcriptional regulator [Mucilaginibacter pedocola]OOQ62009.1 AraC family transcriptional regulator [Mucilaginibacter pedocola]
MKLYIKNMVCSRCKMVVKAEAEKLALHPTTVELGELDLDVEPDKATMETFGANLRKLGFEIIDNRKSRIIEQIKTAVINLIHHQQEHPNTNLSDYLAAKLNYEYGYLSSLFSEVEGSTIEKYAISQKIERVKELMMYDELTLSEIANQMGYSSVAYLSAQFKKQTGLTPSFYKSLKDKKRQNIEDL